jgi:uncharacterized OB-fold protein
MFEAPYVVGFVRLEVDVRLYARLETSGAAALVAAGTPVRIVAREDGGVRCVVEDRARG